MPNTVALFLRAINVGTHNRITMADLKAVIEGTGLGKAETFLQTGNVRLDTTHEPEVAAGIVEYAMATYGLKGAVAVPVLWERLKELVAGDPYAGKVGEQWRSMGIFLRAPLERHAATLGEQEGWSVVGSEPEVLYAVVQRGKTPSIDLRKLPSGPINTPATMRFWNVVEDFVAKFD